MQSNHVYIPDTAIAERYSVSRATVWRWAQRGKFPAPVILSPGCTRWRLADVEQWEESRNQKATA